MNAFSESTMAAAQRLLDNAIAKFEEYADAADLPADQRDPALFSRGFADLLRLRGALHAVDQLEQLTSDVEKADTERPSSIRVAK